MRANWRVVPVTRCYSRVTRTHSAATRSRASPLRVVDDPVRKKLTVLIDHRREADDCPDRNVQFLVAVEGEADGFHAPQSRKSTGFGKEKGAPTPCGCPAPLASREPRTGVQIALRRAVTCFCRFRGWTPAGEASKRLCGARRGLNAHRAGPTAQFSASGHGGGGVMGARRQGAIFAPAGVALPPIQAGAFGAIFATPGPAATPFRPGPRHPTTFPRPSRLIRMRDDVSGWAGAKARPRWDSREPPGSLTPPARPPCA